VKKKEILNRFVFDNVNCFVLSPFRKRFFGIKRLLRYSTFRKRFKSTRVLNFNLSNFNLKFFDYNKKDCLILFNSKLLKVISLFFDFYKVSTKLNFNKLE